MASGDMDMVLAARAEAGMCMCMVLAGQAEAGMCMRMVVSLACLGMGAAAAAVAAIVLRSRSP